MWKKKITFYLVLDQKQNNKILTITATKKEAIEFGYRFLKVKHYDHYNRWCELKNLNPDSDNAWARYFMNVLTMEEKIQYAVAKRIYELNNVAAIMRMFAGCFPLGCSFDTPTEYSYLKSKLESQELAAKWMKETIEEAKKEEETSSDGEQ